MKRKRSYRIVATMIAMVICFGIAVESAGAVDYKEHTLLELLTMERASNSFEVTVPAGEIMTADTSFSMAAGESVKFHAVYEPREASVDYGLISPDGLFHPIRAEDGYIDASMKISTRGKYTFAIRNNSDVEVRTTGYVNY